MTEKITNLSLPVGGDEQKLKGIAARKVRFPVRHLRILKKSLDARDKGNIRWVYTVECSDEKPVRRDPLAPCGQVKGSPSVVVVGAGPAGLFCAVRLLQWGIRPTVVERGAPVEERASSVRKFFESGVLDPSSNVQFGEGGAGTFSDGKLNTRTGGEEIGEVLELFSAFGAPEEIAYLQKPHIGSDRLQGVVAAMRRYILANGGQVLFHTALTDFAAADGKVVSVSLSDGQILPADAVVLAVGHSARDTFCLLRRKGVAMEQKDFAVGLRIEHLQRNISAAQYGRGYAMLPPADYQLVSHASERAVFTFCMCPGGVVVPSASEAGGVVSNGMSDYARNGVNANSALVVQVRRADYASQDPLAGVEFQRRLERQAFALGGGEYKAPAQRVEDFLHSRPSHGAGEVLPTYARGVAYTDLNGLFPEELGSSLRLALPDMGRRLKGFDCPDALLTGVESRTSSPVRILRDERGESPVLAGLYPCGEGAGYAGGITSAAADGLRIAAKIVKKYM